MTAPNSRLWTLVREIEDRLALLAGIESHRRQIERLSLYEVGYDDIYDTAVAMSPDIKQLKRSLKRLRDTAETLTKKNGKS